MLDLQTHLRETKTFLETLSLIPEQEDVRLEKAAAYDIASHLREFDIDPQDSYADAIHKAGTSAGAIAGWVKRRQRKFQDQLDQALQSRNPRAIAHAKKLLARWTAIRANVEAKLAAIREKYKSLPGEYDESKHKRDNDGKFATKEGTGVDSAEAAKPKDVAAAEAPAKPKRGTFHREQWAEMPVPDRVKNWKALGRDEQDVQADAEHSIGRIQNERLAFAGARPDKGTPSEATAARLAQIGDFITSDAGEKIQKHMDALDGFFKELNVDETTSREIALELTDALAAQENESLGRTLGDHGVRHVLGDVEMALDILDKIPGEDNPKTKAAMTIAGALHDIGYMTEPSQVFLDGAHPRWSGQHYEMNVKPLVERALGADAANHIGYMIDTHAGTLLDWEDDPEVSALRLADNIALFHKEKLPGILKYVPENIPVLEKLGTKEITLDEAKRQMLINVEAKEGLSDKVRSALRKASDEVSPVLVKSTLGMMAGEVSKFAWDQDQKSIDAFLHRNDEAQRLQTVLDLGQKQFSKFAEAFGIDPKKFKEDSQFDFAHNGKRALRVFITGAELKAKYEEDKHKRDKDGQFAKKNEGKETSAKKKATLTVMHGTTKGALASILKNGIRPGGGADGTRIWSEDKFTKGKRAGATYVTTDEVMASAFAIIAANFEKTGEFTADFWEDMGSEKELKQINRKVAKMRGIVIQLEIPKDRLKLDDLGSEGNVDFKYNGTIPPEYITGYTVYGWQSKKHSGFIPVKKSDTQRFYTMVVVDTSDTDEPAEEKAKYEEPEHPRDEGGQWTDKDAMPGADEPDANKKNASPLKLKSHIIRQRLADATVKVTMKNGETKDKVVPQYKFIDSATGKEVKDKTKLATWRGLAPPNVTDVVINPDPAGDMTATWRSAKGVLCYAYSKKSSKENAAEKFQKLSDFNKMLPKMRKQIRDDMTQTDDPKLRAAATVAYLIDRTGFRIGGDVSKKIGHYGATTLLSKHVTIKGKNLKFKFIGKHAVEIRKSMNDAVLAVELGKRKSAAWSTPLFDIPVSRVAAYFKTISKGKFSAKDFRMWNGTDTAVRWIKKRKGPAPDEKTFAKWQKEVGGKVAAHLGNTATVAIGSYIDPHVWQPWRKPEWGTFVPKKLKDAD